MFQAGIRQLEAGNLAAANEIFRTIVRHQPRHGGAWHLLGVVMQQQGDLAEAERCLRQALRLEPRVAVIHQDLGEVHRLGHQFDAARACFQRALAINPALPQAHNSLGLLHLARGENQEARACFRQATTCDPGFFQAHHNLGITHLQEAHPADALPCFQRAIHIDPAQRNAYPAMLEACRGARQLEAGAGFLRQVRALVPDSPWAALFLAITLRELGRPGEALPHHHHAVRLAPQASEVYNELGLTLQRLHRWDEAMVAHEAALAGDPGAAIPLNNIGVIHHTRQQLPEAEVRFRDALAREPGYRDAARNLAIVLLQQGKKKEATSLLQSMRQQWPRDPMPLVLLGSLRKELNDLDGAMGLLRTALELDPRAVEVHNDMGHLLTLQRRWPEALEHLRQAVALNPAFPPAWLNLGNALLETREPNAAEGCFRTLLSLDANSVDGHNNLGCALREMGRFEEALACFRRAVAGNPRFDSSLHNLWNVQQRQGRLEAARQEFLALRDRYADNAIVHKILGNIHKEMGLVSEAVRFYQEAIDLAPGYQHAHNDLGIVHQETGQLDAAMVCFHAALAIQPDYAMAINNMGIVHQNRDDLAQAQACFQQAIVMDSDYVDAYNNLGTVHQDLEQPEAAMACYRQAMALDPEFAPAHFNLGMSLLGAGELKEGFEQYEWRWRMDGNHMLNVNRPVWQGEEVAGKSVLLYVEQGLGDTVQFMRFARAIVERGGRVVVQSQAPLVNLLWDMPVVNQVVALDEILPNFDYHLPLLSLPRVLGVTLATLPREMPYLTVRPERVAVWRERLAGYEGLKIGLAWRGNPAHKNDRNRSLGDTRLLLPLLELPGITFFSLQKEPRPDDLAPLSPRPGFVDLRPHLTDLVETAAVIAEMDLVIAVDTVITHLAGALAKPVWLLLPFIPDWRWIPYAGVSDWYPTIRLFRQSSRGDWAGVVERVRRELHEGAGVMGSLPESNDNAP